MKNVLSAMFVLLAPLMASTAIAQTAYPEKPIRIIIGYPPGSPSDIVARLLSQKWTETLGKPVVVDNIAGAAGNIGTERVAKAAPDGYTLGLMIQGQIAINPSLYNLPYDPVTDFAAVSQTTLSPIGVVLPQVRDGKLRALAVTPLRRSAALPDVPTIDESGVRGFEASSWNGLLAPSGTPAPIIRTLHQETVKALALPDVRSKLADLGMEGVGNTPEEFAALIKATIPKWARLIREAGIKPE